MYLKYIHDTAIASVKVALNIGSPPVLGWVKLGVSLLLGYFLPMRDVVHLILILILADAVLSITELYVDKRAKSKFKRTSFLMIVPNWLSGFDSDKLGKTVAKAIFYVLGLMLIFYFEKVAVSFISDGLWLFKGIALLMSAGELFSCFKHIANITGNRIFLKIAEFINQKQKDKTGIDLDKETNETDL